MNKIYLIGGIALTVSIAAIGILSNRLKAVTEERDIQLKNVETLFTDVENYEVRDSLKAATIADLQLTLSQYKRFREEDAELISDLKVDNNRLQGVVTAQTESYYQHTASLRDSVRILVTRKPDSVRIPIIVKTASFEDQWHKLNIVINKDSLSYSLRTTESLLITNHIVPKRFLWFRFGCKEVRTDVVSKNPYVEKIDVESIMIK